MKKKKLSQWQKDNIAIILAYHRCCEVIWENSKKEAADKACKMIEDIVLNNGYTEKPPAHKRRVRH